MKIKHRNPVAVAVLAAMWFLLFGAFFLMAMLFVQIELNKYVTIR